MIFSPRSRIRVRGSATSQWMERQTSKLHLHGASTPKQTRSCKWLFLASFACRVSLAEKLACRAFARGSSPSFLRRVFVAEKLACRAFARESSPSFLRRGSCERHSKVKSARKPRVNEATDRLMYAKNTNGQYWICVDDQNHVEMAMCSKLFHGNNFCVVLLIPVVFQR